jgi:hypothetical protein
MIRLPAGRQAHRLKAPLTIQAQLIPMLPFRTRDQALGGGEGPGEEHRVSRQVGCRRNTSSDYRSQDQDRHHNTLHD